MPTVSVVMAVRNGETTILRSVNSILSQSFSDFEFLIANDYSTDNTSTILKGIADSRVRLLQAPDKGLVPALNFCLQQAKGKYIARMDADDYAYPNRLQDQVQLLENEEDIGVVSGIVNHVSTQGKQEGYAHHVDQINLIVEPEDHYINRFRDSPVANPSVLFRRSLLEKFGYYHHSCPEDYEFWLRLLHNGVQFKKIPTVVLDWYDYSNRLTRTSKNYSEEAFSKTKAHYFSQWWQSKKRSKKLWVWGYGKEVFSKSKWVEMAGVEIEGYIDIKERPNASRKVLHYSKINKEDVFILAYIGDRKGQQNIQKWLSDNYYEASKDYYFMS